MVLITNAVVQSLRVSGGDILSIGTIAEGESWTRSGDTLIGTAPAGGWVDDGTQVRLATASRKVGIGTAAPNAKLDVQGPLAGTVGGFSSGSVHVTSDSATKFANSVITGHNLFDTNTQLWYLGSTSSSNDDIAFINRQNSALSLLTNSTERLRIEPGGSVGIGTVAAPSAILTLQSITKGFLPPRMSTAQGNAITSPATALIVFDTDKDRMRVRRPSAWEYIHSGIITGQFSHGVSQKPGVTTPVSLLFDMNDIALEGISHSTSVKSEEFTATIQKAYTFTLAPQWERTSSGPAETIDFFIQISTDEGTTFTDIDNSNVKVKADANENNVIILMATIALNVNDIIRFQMRVSATGDGLGTVFTAAETGPPTIPATPAQILTITSGD